MGKTFKVLSLLLTYPEEEIQAAAGEMKQILESEKLVPANCLKGLSQLLDEIGSGDLFDLQERYVLLFDRSRSLSLHLFEHIHGESRERGQALVDLAAHYEKHGLVIGAKELPDFLPLFLEFLGTRPEKEARELLGQPLNVIAVLGERLRKRRSPYAWVFLALQGIAAGKPVKSEIESLLAEPDEDPSDLEALDRAWEDQPVTFGPGAARRHATPWRGWIIPPNRSPLQALRPTIQIEEFAPWPLS